MLKLWKGRVGREEGGLEVSVESCSIGGEAMEAEMQSEVWAGRQRF